MRHRIAVLAIVAGMLSVIAGCGLGDSPAGAYVAIAKEGGDDGGLAALLEGRLAEADGCLWVTTDAGERHLPIWPHGARAYGVPDGPTVVVEVKGRKFIVGSAVALGGGEVSGIALGGGDVHFIDSLLESPVPTACGVGPFWAVSSVDVDP